MHGERQLYMYYTLHLYMHQDPRRVRYQHSFSRFAISYEYRFAYPVAHVSGLKDLNALFSNST